MSGDGHYISEGRRDRERLGGPMPSENELVGFLLGDNTIEIDTYVLRQIDGREYLRDEFFQIQATLLPELGSGQEVLTALRALLAARQGGPKALAALASNDLQPRWLRTRARVRLPSKPPADDSAEGQSGTSAQVPQTVPPPWLERALDHLREDNGWPTAPTFTSWEAALPTPSAADDGNIASRLSGQFADVYSDGTFLLTNETAGRSATLGSNDSEQMQLPKISFDEGLTVPAHRVRVSLSMLRSIHAAVLAIRLQVPGELWGMVPLAPDLSHPGEWIGQIPDQLSRLLGSYETQALYILVELS